MLQELAALREELILMAEFWSSIPIHILLGLAAALPLVLWDWRVALPGLLLVQLGIGGITGSVYGLPPPWPAVHFGVLLLASLILMLSILQTSSVRVDHSGEFSSVLFRFLIMGLAALLVWKAGGSIALPLLSDATKALFLWLAVLAILTLGLTETALFGGIALHLWLIPVQAFLSVLFPLPALIIPMGILQLLVALAVSYLLLSEDEALSSALAPATDSDFSLPERVDAIGRRRSIPAGLQILWYSIAYLVATPLRGEEKHRSKLDRGR